MRGSCLPAALLVCCIALGCRDKGQPVGDQAPEVSLLAAGSAPRRALSYQPVDRDRQLELTIELDAGIPGEGMKLGLVLDWSEAGTADGRPRRDYAVTGADAASMPASAGAQEAQIIRMIASSYRGTAGHALSTPSGHVAFAQTAGKPMTPNLTWLLSVAVVPLPVEPVGVGARWRAVQRGTIEGAAYVLDRTYELVALEADGARLRVTGEQVVAVGQGDADASTMDGLTMGMRVAGDVAIGFGDVLPRSGRWSLVPELGELPGEELPGEERTSDDGDGPGVVFAIVR